jgi:hypothetical protein
VRPLCASCGLRPPRPPTSRWPDPKFCAPCVWGEDQKPVDYDLQLSRRRDRGVVRGRLQASSRRLAVGSVLQARARRLLAQLRGIDRWVWHLVGKGASERKIAEMLGLTRQEAYGWYLGRLRAAAGIPARPKRYNRRGA